MKINTFFYCVKQGIRNIFRNILFSLASMATVSACIFLFCLFFSIIMNVKNLVYEAETTVGITVFFDEELDDAGKEAIKEAVLERGGVKDIRYISAEEAWENFKEDYLGDKAEQLSDAFQDDNPLAHSDSYEIFMERIEDQQHMAEYIKGLQGVREVNYANTVVSALKSANKVISILSVVIISVLFAVSVFLISNTISVAAAFRKRENEIMKLIGATNFMIRAPFVVEGVLIGLIGAVVPLAGFYFIYERINMYLVSQFAGNAISSAFSEIVRLIPVMDIYPVLLMVGMLLGVGMGFLVSFFTIRKHLKV